MGDGMNLLSKLFQKIKRIILPSFSIYDAEQMRKRLRQIERDLKAGEIDRKAFNDEIDQMLLRIDRGPI